MNPSAFLPATALAFAAAITISLLAPQAWLVLPTDGVYPAALLLAAAGWGVWPAAWLLPGECGLRRGLLAFGLGLGGLSLTALVLGLLGWMSAPIAWALVSAGGLLLLMRLGGKPPVRCSVARRESLAALLLRTAALIPLGVLLGYLVTGACLPPRMLWEGEGFGYDVLEYHLNAPRAYFEAGRIAFLPHNVYAAFPQQMELLYWLLMLLRGSVIDAAIPAQLLHAAIAVLAVLTVGAWARAEPSAEPSRPQRSAHLTAWLLAGGAAWVVYCGVLAYVESGLLLFAGLAGGVLRGCLSAPPETNHRRALIAAGICAGLAAGCKYTAIVLVGGALALVWLLAAPGDLRRRMTGAGFFALTAALVFAPWMGRGLLQSGNPVYPFGYGWFGGVAWSAEQDQQWDRGHRPKSEDSSAAGRLRVAARELIGSWDASRGFRSSWFGPLLWVAALTGGVWAARRVPRVAWFDWTWLAVTLAAWALLTHMPGRFALTAVIPAALLGAQAGRLGVFLGFAHAVCGALVIAALFGDHARNWQRRTDVPLAMMIGRPDLLVNDHPLNRLTPADANLWIVGDAATFYIQRRHHYTAVFNRDPWIAAVSVSEDGGVESAFAAVEWLRTRGVTHVSFSWIEVQRLRATYGFAEHVTPEWAESLRAGGLRLVEQVRDGRGRLLSELYEVTPPAAAGD